MEFQEMKKLESEVKGLHHLMREVHKNQVELNRVLLSRCNYSRSNKFGDPEVLKDSEPTKLVPEVAEVTKCPLPTPEVDEKPVKEKPQKPASPSASETKQECEQPAKVQESPPESSEVRKTQQLTCTPPKTSAQSSSFIRNILSEDSRAGVAIIDLFLTVKMAKDNLQYLSRSNAEAFDKIKQLKTETVAIGKGYRLLLDDMRDLLTRMNESILHRRTLPAVIHLRGKPSHRSKISEYVLERTGDEENSRGSQTPMTSQESDVDTVRSEDVVRDDADGRGARRKWGGGSRSLLKQERRRADVSDSSSSGCLSCFVSSHKDILFDELPDLSEASLASFVATLFRMQKGERRVCETCKSSSLFATSGEEEESDGKLSLSDSSFRMFCNICEILDGAARDDLGSDQDFLDEVEKDDHRSLSPRIGAQYRRDDRSISHCPTGTSSSRPAPETSKDCSSCRKKSLRTKSSKREAAIDTESEFDDITGHVVRSLPRPEPKAKPSVNCMGDLTRAAPGKKNVSTLTTTNNILSYRKLPNDIRSKIKRIRSKKNMKADKHKSGKGSKRAFGKNKFSGGTPSDDPDHGKPLRGIGVPGLGQTVAPDSDSTSPTGCANPRGDDYMSEDSFHNCDSESADAGFNSGDDDMEEFVEIFNENSRAAGKAVPPQHERAITWHDDSLDLPDSREFEPSNSFLGFLHKTTLKTFRTLFFEIQKCYPAYFVQEILPKRILQTPEEPMDDGSISLDPAENQQKKVVIKGSSTDFVIYIQVEMEDGSRAGSQEFKVERRVSISGTQTGSLVHPKEIGTRTEEEDDDGQSVGDVWEECDGGRLGELDESEAGVAHSEVERPCSRHRKQKESLGTDARARQTKDLNADTREQKTKDLNADTREQKTKDLNADTREQKTKDLNADAREQQTKDLNADAREQQTKDLNADAREQKTESLNKDARAQNRIKEREPKRMGAAVTVAIKQAKRHADIWLHQNAQHRIFFGVVLKATGATTTAAEETASAAPQELEKALNLIREVENDITDVKLSDAISILPRLEWELRKHLRSKMKILGETEPGNENADRNLFSSVNFWPEEETPDGVNSDASERMRKLLMMLTELENAIKSNESAKGSSFCPYDPSKVYKLLRALVASIQGLEGDASVSNLSQTLEIASQLDTAVREYDSIVRKRPADYLSPESGKYWKTNPEGMESVPEKQHLKNVRKKVFQTVEGEALQLEGRVERDFARLTHLERENDEAMTFLEAFLQKMKRRMSELHSLKDDIKKMSVSIREKQENLMEKVAQKGRERERREAEAQRRAKELKEAEAEAEQRAAQAKAAEAEAQRRAAQVREAEAETQRRAAKLKEAEVEAQRRANQLREAEAQRRAAQLREVEAEKRAAQAKEAEAQKRAAQAKEAEAQRRAAQAKGAEAQRKAAQAKEAEVQRRAVQLKEAEAEAQRRVAQVEAERRTTLLKEAEAEAQKRAAQLKEAETKRRAAQLKEAEAEALKRTAQLKEAEAQKRAALMREAEAKSRAAQLKEAEAEAQRRANQLKHAEAQRRDPRPEETEPHKEDAEPTEAEKKAAEPNQAKEVEARERASQAKETEAPRRVTQVKEGDPRPPSPKEVVLKETVSGLLLALDRLKARAREKNQLCKEILSSSCSDKMRVSGSSSRRASRSSFTAKHTETLTSSVTTLRKIGPTSLYLSWSKPEGSLKEFVSGYEIYLNGKLNQKVRDARRLQAVLYSVDFSNGVDIEMYAIAENHPKALLLTARYQEE